MKREFIEKSKRTLQIGQTMSLFFVISICMPLGSMLFDNNYYPRICNKVADILANQAKFKDLKILLEDPSSDITSPLVYDISN